MFKAPRGTRDFLPEEMRERRYVEECLRRVFEDYGYREVVTPTFETLELITAKSGEEIKRHLYHFTDKSGRRLALRPELTAPVMRLYVNRLRFSPKPLKLYYIGNCFRYERPQSGRYREFWQAGVELIGSPYPEAEAEVIVLAVDAIRRLGLRGYELAIGSIGTLRAVLDESGIKGDAQNLVMSAIDKGEGLQELLDDKGVRGRERDVLMGMLTLRGEKQRVLRDAEELLRDSPKALKELDSLREVLRFLEEYGVGEYVLDLGIARGLDYYTGVVFEIYAPGLGAEKQICGGGAYSLAEVFGGEAVATCGFAFGFDRLVLALKKEKKALLPAVSNGCLVVPTSEGMLSVAVKVAQDLRRNNLCELELTRRKLGKALSYADRRGFRYAAIVGEAEVGKGCILLRDMKTGEQREIEIGKLKELKL
jgi:histidyl-tRNA synthetase